MNAVGDIADGHLACGPAGEESLENVAAHAAMQFADCVYRAGTVDREVCHVEGLVEIGGVHAAERHQISEGDSQFVFRIPLHVLFHELGREPVKSRFDGRVGGEEIARARNAEAHRERLFLFLHPGARAFQNREGGMAFVEMADLRVDAELAQQTPARDSQNLLLLQARFGTAAIEFAGDAAVLGEVHGIVRIEEVEFRAAYLSLPGANAQGITGEVELDPQPLSVGFAHGRDGELACIVERIERLLAALRVDVLAEVAALIEEPDGDDGNAEVAGGFQLIAGDIAEAARVDGQGVAQHEFHAEVGDRFERRVGVGLLKP